MEALLNQWMARFSIPNEITSDRDTPFTSKLWTGLCQQLGIEAKRTTTYNPEANGMVERLHRTLKAALMTKCNTDDSVTNLPWVLLGLRTTPKKGTNATAADMTYGENIQVPGDFFSSPGRTTLQDIRHEVKKYVLCQPTYKKDRQIYVPPDLHTSSHVFLRVDSHRAPLTPPYIGPFVVQQRRPKMFKIVIRDKPEWVSIDRLNPAYISVDDQPESSSSRYSRAGRPQRKSHFLTGEYCAVSTDNTIDKTRTNCT